MLSDGDEKLLEVLKEIFEAVCVLRDVPHDWKKSLGRSISDLEISMEKNSNENNNN